MLDNLDWKTDSIRQHVMESLLLRDVLLSPEHFVNIRDCREHPKIAVRSLQSSQSYGRVANERWLSRFQCRYARHD